MQLGTKVIESQLACMEKKVDKVLMVSLGKKVKKGLKVLQELKD